MTKKYKKRAEADIGLLFTVYNLRRLINIAGIGVLQNYMAILSFYIEILCAICFNIDRFRLFNYFCQIDNKKPKQSFIIAILDYDLLIIEGF